MSKHTKGPWHRHGLHIHAQYQSETGIRHYAVADALEHGGMATGEPEANARLIEASPTMLAVIKQFDTLVRRLEGTEIEYGLAIALSEVLRNSHEVIIEAIGVEAAMDFIDSTAIQKAESGL